MPQKGKDIQAGKDHVLVIGMPKTGKTRMLGTASRHEKLYILDLENGLATIAGGDFDFDRCNNWDDVLKHFNWFMNNYKKEGYTALGIDSISRAQRYLSDSLMERDSTKKLTRDQFAEMLATMRNMVTAITQATDFTTVALCHQSLGDDGNYYPCLEGQIKFDLSGYFGTVVHTQTGLDKNNKPKYWCTLNGGSVGGTRLRHLKGKTVIANDYKELLAPAK